MQVTQKGSMPQETTQRKVETGESKRYVGTPIKRVEDPRLLTGEDQYIDNLKFPNMAFAGFVRSPYAHARIKKVDLSKLVNEPSVVATVTAEEVRKTSEPIPVVWRVPEAKIHEHYALAQGKVMHVGDPVVAVAVSNREKLEDILELIEVEYETIEPVLDPTDADQKPPIHEELGTNTCFVLPISAGDVESAIREADVLVSEEFKISRLAASPMETRGVIANPRGLHSELTIYSSTQWPHVLRTLLSSCLRIDENKLRVIGPDVGGGFGVKGEVYGEEIAVALLALKSRQPVKWVESRKESFLATTQARDQV
ncbi:MAG: xanthine dehydrogenase family protein molybdopterin-binding subunit, partial [Nitrososphaerales archaeon]